MWFKSRDYLLETKHIAQRVTPWKMSNYHWISSLSVHIQWWNCLWVTGAQFSSLKMLGLVAVLKTKTKHNPLIVVHGVSFTRVIYVCRFLWKTYYLGEFWCLNLLDQFIRQLFTSMLLLSLNHGVIWSLETSTNSPPWHWVFSIIAWYFGCPHAGYLLSSSSNKPLLPMAHRFFVLLTPLNNIPEISNEANKLDNF